MFMFFFFQTTADDNTRLRRHFIPYFVFVDMTHDVEGRTQVRGEGTLDTKGFVQNNRFLVKICLRATRQTTKFTRQPVVNKF